MYIKNHIVGLLFLSFSFSLLATFDKVATLSLDDIKADGYTLKYSGKGVVIAVIEGGFGHHDHIVDNFIEGYDSTNDTPINPADGFAGHSYRQHGIHVVGTICAKPLVERRYGGLAYDAKIIPIINDNSIMEGIRNNLDKYLQAFRFAIDSNARIISISQPLFALNEIRPLFAEGVKKGKIFVVAVGNDGQSKMEKPRYNIDNYIIGTLATDEEIKPGFVVVGALSKISGKTDSQYSTTGYHYGSWKLPRGIGGSDYYSPEFGGNFMWAPGEDILSCGRNVRKESIYYRMSGTSMATPLVASVIALLIEKYPEMASTEIVEMLMSCPKSPNAFERRGEIGNGAILDCSYLFKDSDEQ